MLCWLRGNCRWSSRSPSSRSAPCIDSSTTLSCCVESSPASTAPTRPPTAPASSTPVPGLSNASSLVGYVQDWVNSGPVVKLDWLMAHINQHCPVAIGGLNDPECRPPSLLRPELINTINGVMNTCAVRSLGSQICQESFWKWAISN